MSADRWFEPGTPLSRRRLFVLGGSSAALAALLAACGNDVAPAPGQLGQRPVATDLPALEPDESMYLRTLASVEHSIAAVYAELGAVGLTGADAAALARFTDDHLAAAARFNELAVAAGGAPIECGNAWYDERFLGPLVDHVLGDADASPEIPPSDDPVRDARNLMVGLESFEAASIHQLIHFVTARAEVAALAVTASRRAATAALLANPGPAGYLSPVLSGEAAPLDSDGVPMAYVITGPFGQLLPVAVLVGAADENGSRFDAALATPADNAFVGPDASCEQTIDTSPPSTAGSGSEPQSSVPEQTTAEGSGAPSASQSPGTTGADSDDGSATVSPGGQGPAGTSNS